jgi:hypothetical protein
LRDAVCRPTPSRTQATPSLLKKHTTSHTHPQQSVGHNSHERAGKERPKREAPWYHSLRDSCPSPHHATPHHAHSIGVDQQNQSNHCTTKYRKVPRSNADTITPPPTTHSKATATIPPSVWPRPGGGTPVPGAAARGLNRCGTVVARGYSPRQRLGQSQGQRTRRLHRRCSLGQSGRR